MNEKIAESMRFYLMATKLKNKLRTGWTSTHWNVKGRGESVAEHVYGTCILAISLYSNMDIDIDFDKVLKMLVLHEIGEVIIGDITPYDKVSPEDKMEMEHKAMLEVLGDLTSKDELYELLIEFDNHETKESKFAYMCDKMDADIQSKVYQDNGLTHDLDSDLIGDIKNTERFKSAVENGDTKQFDVWYRYDKDKYDELFLGVLNYIKDNDTNVV